MSDKCAKIIVGLVINEQTGAKSLDEVKLDLDNLIWRYCQPKLKLKFTRVVVV